MASVGDTSATAGRKTINLALQGGGSHGAFAWGALDRILEDERIVIEGIVGTSAGAMNATASPILRQSPVMDPLLRRMTVRTIALDVPRPRSRAHRGIKAPTRIRRSARRRNSVMTRIQPQ